MGWQGAAGQTTVGSTLVDGLRSATQSEVVFSRTGESEDDARCDVGIVCIAEPPYAEGPGDSAAPTVSDEDRRVFQSMRSRADRLILVIYSGRPLVVPDLIAEADAVVAAWLPGSEAGALGDLLMGHHEFAARTAQPWPRSIGDLGDPRATPLFPVGHGLRSSSAMIGHSPDIDRLI